MYLDLGREDRVRKVDHQRRATGCRVWPGEDCCALSLGIDDLDSCDKRGIVGFEDLNRAGERSRGEAHKQPLWVGPMT